MDNKTRILTVIGIIAFVIYLASQAALRSAQAQINSSREQAQEHAEQIANQAQQYAQTTQEQAAEIAARVNETLEAAQNTSETAQNTSETAQNIHAPKYCFRNQDLLVYHFQKHGIEMGFGSPEDYELAAVAVVTNPDALHKTEAEDGDDVYYIEETNEFVVVSTDGYIRTYFYPSDGKDYYDRQ